MNVISPLSANGTVNFLVPDLIYHEDRSDVTLYVGYWLYVNENFID